MKTEQLYLLNPYLKETKAKILEVIPEADAAKIILDKTVFYPMGGGQPTDQGVFTLDDGSTLDVYQVLIKDGEICHYVKAGKTDLVGKEVTVSINWDRRFKHMQIHSAGHVIDFAVFVLGLSPNTLSPQKGDHGKKPFITYKGIVPSDVKEKIQDKVNEIVNKNMQFSWKMVSLDELKQTAIYLQPNLPENKPLRMLTLEGIGSVADGGTIVKSTSEVGNIIISDVVSVNDETTISYLVQEAGSQTQESSKKETSNIEITNDSLKTLIAEAKEKLNLLKTEEELTNLWRSYLGKDGILKDALSKISQIDPAERKTYGAEVNQVKEIIDSEINAAKKALLDSKDELYLLQNQKQLDLIKPKIGHVHPLTQTINELNEIFNRLGYSIMDGPEIETDEYCFQRLNLPLDHPARDLQDSIFIEEPNILLRTQTSSIEARVLETFEPPYKVVMPGRVYRNEKVNRSNHFTFHQYQLVVVKEKVSLAELISTIEHLFKTYLGEDVVTRYRNKYYPEVEPGVGPDMQCFNCHGVGCPLCKGRGWLEMGGAGIIHPKVLQMAGIDSNKWQGYAFGLGLDRWAMAKHNIKDIRTLLGGNLSYKPDVG